MASYAFGRSPRYSVGVEEELFLVDAATCLPAPAPEAILDGVRVGSELFTSIVELRTPACESASDAAAALADVRAAAAGRARAHGLALLAAATHPLARLDRQEIADDPGLRAFADYAGPAARAQYCCGLHVHVGVRDAAECVAALEGVLPWLPLVLALSASSPFLEGRETGLASTRADLLRRLPRSGAPPVFRTLERWQTFVDTLVSLGLADDYRRLWWDARPHPRLGTLELRIADQPTRLEVAGALAALLQALVASVGPGRPADRGLYDQNRFAALRFGSAAELVHPDGSRLATVPELTQELLHRVGPAARRLGSGHLLAPLPELARRSQADAQLEAARAHSLAAVARRLAEETAGRGSPGDRDRTALPGR